MTMKGLFIRSIKLIDIGFLTVIYFALGILIAKGVDALYGEFDEEAEKRKSMIQITVELMILMWLLGIIVYMARNLVELIPFPLDNISGFDHLQLKELKAATVFVFILMHFTRHFRQKLQYYYDHIRL